MTRKKWWLGGLFTILAIAAAWRCYAQYQVEPERRRPSSYRVRVVNEMGQPICVKIIPYGHSNYFHADLGPRESETRDLWSGQRALCVWDDKTGELLIAAEVKINRNGVLRIRPLYAAASAEPGKAEAPRRAMPSVEIESD
jgi:hypothetical protein